jgi:type II secretory pathway pseudopilin PulG
MRTIVKAKNTGLTMVEILVVVGIIALLTGMLIPAISMVRRTAKEAKQKVQFTAIELGLAAFKNDYGDYPPSDSYSYTNEADGTEDKINSAGALKLSEALLGLDLLGFHPNSGWRVDGMNRWPYRVGTTTYASGTYFLYDRSNAAEMAKRKGRYMELDVADAFQLGATSSHDGLFNLSSYGDYANAADCFVLCDVFGKGKDVTLSDGRRARAGRPILYYRADSAGKFAEQTYNYRDNDNLVAIIEDTDTARMGSPSGRSLWNPLAGASNVFYTNIADPRASTTDSRVAYRPDSYILISAGADGFYGTSDDIHNFGR